MERQNASQISPQLSSTRSRVFRNVSQFYHILDFGESTSPLISKRRYKFLTMNELFAVQAD